MAGGAVAAADSGRAVLGAQLRRGRLGGAGNPVPAGDLRRAATRDDGGGHPGDALTGDVSPLLVLVSLCTATLGISGLVYETRRYRRESAR